MRLSARRLPRDHSVAALRTAALGVAADSGFNYDIFMATTRRLRMCWPARRRFQCSPSDVVVYKSVEKPGSRGRQTPALFLGSE